MTTREFINANYGVKQPRTRWCSSVYVGMNGNIYSYGPHYPLLFEVNGTTYRNTRGYSNTTARHILWSRDIKAIDVPLDRQAVERINKSYYEDHEKEKEIVRCLADEMATAKAEMDKKKRKDTQVFKWLKYDFEQAKQRFELVSGLKVSAA